jgi:Bacterial Ig-like domain
MAFRGNPAAAIVYAVPGFIGGMSAEILLRRKKMKNGINSTMCAVGLSLALMTTLHCSLAFAESPLISLFDGSVLLGTVTADSGGTWNFATPTLSDGNHNFTATDTVAGSTSQVSSPLNVTVDTHVPVAPVIASSLAQTGTVGWLDGIGGTVTAAPNSVALTGTAEANSTVTIFDGTTLIGTAVTNGSGTWSYKTGLLTAGTHGFSATDTDAAGNTSQASSVLNVAVNTLMTITSDSDTYANNTNTYSVALAPWNKGSLINGIDYTQTITFDPATFPNGVDFSWSWPMTHSRSWYVLAMPDVKFTPLYDLPNEAPIYTQSGNIIDLTSNYNVSISGDTKDFNVSFDVFFRDKPNGVILDELMVWVHLPTAHMGTNQPYTVTVSGVTNEVVISPTSGAASWTLIGLESTGGDVLSNSLSLSDIFKTLIWNGVLTGQEYISDVMFGSEITAGSGGLHINNLSYNFTAKPSLVGTAGNDTFVINSMGGNNVIGNGGVDTVVYPGSYSNYQIKSSGSEILVTKGNNISTLDELNGIKFIQFADGKYDIATASFTSM